MEHLYDMGLADNGRGILFTKSSAIHGYGLFTGWDLPAGTILCRRLGLRTELSLRDKRAILGVDSYDPANPDDLIFKSINHSCQPNTLLTDTGCLINIWPLSAGIEITVDYGLLLAGSPWSMPCLCGQTGCRQIIKANIQNTN